MVIDMKINTSEIIYNDAIDKEFEWKKSATLNDLQLLDNLLKRIKNQCNIDVNYLADLTNRPIRSKEVVSLIEDTLLKWDDRGIEAMLVGAIGKKGNNQIVKTVIESYERLNEVEKKQYHAFYDNALTNIGDKSLIQQYVKWAQSWRDLANLPLLMCSLGKWHIEDAKDIFIEQLFSREDYELYDPIHYLTQRNHAYIVAILALSKFNPTDDKIAKALLKIYNDTDCVNIRDCAKQAIKKLRI